LDFWRRDTKRLDVATDLQSGLDIRRLAGVGPGKGAADVKAISI
jgi:hypothetical protein